MSVRAVPLEVSSVHRQEAKNVGHNVRVDGRISILVAVWLWVSSYEKIENEIIVDEVLMVLRQTIGRNQLVSSDTSLFSGLDLDSLQLSEVIAALEHHFQVDLLTSAEDLRAIETPNAIAGVIKALKQPDVS